MNSNNLDHLAIIMDGNGRWALERGLDRTAGHAAGEHSLSKTIDWAIKNNIQWLTVYAFSTENWLRSDDEVEYLMFFNRDILLRRRDEFNQAQVQSALRQYQQPLPARGNWTHLNLRPRPAVLLRHPGSRLHARRGGQPPEAHAQVHR